MRQQAHVLAAVAALVPLVLVVGPVAVAVVGFRQAPQALRYPGRAVAVEVRPQAVRHQAQTAAEMVGLAFRLAHPGQAIPAAVAVALAEPQTERSSPDSGLGEMAVPV